jgi:hypothetical protein
MSPYRIGVNSIMNYVIATNNAVANSTRREEKSCTLCINDSCQSYKFSPHPAAQALLVRRNDIFFKFLIYLS